MGVIPEGDVATGFVVRDGGSWWLAPVPVSAPQAVALDDVLVAVAEAPATGGRPEVQVAGTDVAALAGSDVLAPVWAWVGSVTASGVLLEGNDGRSLVLDGDDLRLLDALDEPVTVADLARAAGVDDAPDRLARLVAAGRLRRLPPGEAVAPQEPAAAPLPPSRPARAEGPSGGDARVGVHAVWQERVGPALSLGMLTACARAWDGGALNERYDLRRPETAEELLVALGQGRGPAVLLCSNYVWSLEHNLGVARAAKALRPELVVIHGGPSTPRFPGDAQRFLAEHGDVADVLVRGEGEVTLCRILEALAPTLPTVDAERLGAIAGITFVDPRSGDVVRTGEPERVADLDSLPSPYLTGEFDHIDPAAWLYSVSIETNRGCPYGCTFCDWGSATLSRIRKFSADRVLAEFQWVADRGIAGIQICDANFGIMSRDVDLTRGLAEIGQRHAAPKFFSFTPAKNTTRHVTKIFDAAMDAGLLVSTAISLQTIDEGTLAAVERSNISTDGYLALAADLRRRSLPLQGDLLIGLPGQTYASYKADLQFFLDHQIAPRSWSLRALPNSPMNAPDYRARYQIETDDDQIVTSTSTMSPGTRDQMLALRKIQVIADQYGLLSHLMRFLQWDHAIAMTELLDHLVDVTTRTPARFPLVTWVFEYFDVHATVAVGWHAFYDELLRLVADDYGLDPSAGDLETVLRLQVALMPAPRRRFPATVDLDHDYSAYYRDATAGLHTTGHASTPPRPLVEYPPAPFTVTGDPLGLCTGGLRFEGDSRDESMLGQFWLGVGSSYELLSMLTRVAPEFRDLEIAASVAGGRAATEGAAEDPVSDPGDERPSAPTPVTIGRSGLEEERTTARTLWV